MFGCVASASIGSFMLDYKEDIGPLPRFPKTVCKFLQEFTFIDVF